MSEAQNLQNMRDRQLNNHLKSSELNEFQILEGERLFLDSLHRTRELPLEVEGEDFEVYKLHEIFKQSELEAIAQIIKEDEAFDLDFEDFYNNYVLLSSRLRTKEVKKTGKALKRDTEYFTAWVDSLGGMFEKIA